MALRQPNPVLSKSFSSEMETPESSTPMTMEGTVNKTGFLLVILALASASVYFGPSGLVNTVASMYIVLVLATVGIAIGVAVRPHLAKNLAVSYAVIEGLLLGTLSRMLNSELPGSDHGEAFKAILSRFDKSESANAYLDGYEAAETALAMPQELKKLLNK